VSPATLTFTVLGVLAAVACGDDEPPPVAGDAGTIDDSDAGTMEGDAGMPPVDFMEPTYANRMGVDPMLSAPTDLVAPGFVPAADSPVAAMAATPPAPLDVTATYVGAIAPGGEDWTAGWTAYPADGSGVTETAADGCPALDAREVVMVSEDLTTPTAWTCDKLYVLAAPIYVSAELSIAPGTVIRGDNGPSTLVITTAGRIDAVGTAAAPIVFTSAKPTDRQPGDWGGLVLLGNAPLNVAGGTENIEGLEPTEARGQYGGTDPSHDCGTLEYVRIEYAGYVFGDDNELNGLTLGGCGAGTTVDYVQVHLGLDDGVELFGGTASISHVVVTRVGDDSLDWDEGWTGSAQFFIAQQDNVGNRTIEADNLEEMRDATPRSAPRIWNATLIGAGQDDQQGMRLREGTAAEIANTIMMGFDLEPCVTIQHDESIAQAVAGELTIRNSVFMGCGSGPVVFAPTE
jgi:hypothetical protein